MRAYIIKRLLLMVPTLFGISLIIFLVINFAPGRPGAQKAAREGQRVGDQATQESYRVFKEQYHLDKPIILNTRPWLKPADIRALVLQLQSEEPAKQIEAERRLEDYGDDAIPGLVAMLEDEQLSFPQQAAVFHLLAQNAQRRIEGVALAKGRQTYTPEQLAQIEHEREIAQDNAVLRARRFDRKSLHRLLGDDWEQQVQDGALGTRDAMQRQAEVFRREWLDWYAREKDRYAYTAWTRITTCLFDTRYAHYMGNLLTGDLGDSLEGGRVWDKIAERWKYSIVLSLASIFLAYLVSIPLGILSAVRQNRLDDRAVTVVLFMLYSLPTFFVGTLMVRYLTTGHPVQWFPTGGFMSMDTAGMTTLDRLRDVAYHLVLPVACLTYASFAALSRFARVGLLEVVRADYIRTARAKGLSGWAVIMKHALRNGIIPILTLMAGLLPALFGGSVIVEYIFNIPGLGKFTLEAIFSRDYNVIMGIQLIAATLVLFGILLTDIAYAIVDPRISYD